MAQPIGDWSEPEMKSSWVVRSVPGVKSLLYSGPGVRIPEHTHENTFVTFVVSGVSDETDDRGHMKRIGPESLTYSPAGTRHAHNYLTKRVTTLCAEFSPGMTRLMNGPGLTLDGPRVIQSGATIEVSRRIAREVSATDEASNLVLQGLFIELLGELARAPQDEVGQAPDWLRVACSMLRDTSGRNLNIQEIAAEVAVHPSHLARCFRKYMGQSPGEFARRVRLERASSELLRTSKPLKTIAHESGFADLAHFSREFKRAFGHAPSAARRNGTALSVD